MKRLLAWLSTLAFCFMTGFAWAGVTVVAGSTRPMYSPNTWQLAPKTIKHLAQQSTHLKPPQGGLPAFKSLLKTCPYGQAAVVKRAHLKRALFVVGPDARSIAWLKRQRSQLQKMHAVGFVLQVKPLKAIRALQRAAGSLALYPARGRALKTALQVPCYPAFIMPSTEEALS